MSPIRIEFHFNVPERLTYACRLLRKAVSKGAHVQVVGDDRAVGDLDRLLWTVSAQSFMPHCWASAGSDVLRNTPIVMWRGADRFPGHAAAGAALPRQVLVNLGPEVPATFDGFARLIELVDDDHEVRVAARARWKAYAQLGHELQRHDYTQAGA